jgi:hypothetical protein
MRREKYGTKEDVVTKIEKNMLKWLGNEKRMDKRSLSKDI